MVIGGYSKRDLVRMNLSLFNLGNSKDLQLENGSIKFENLHP